MFAVHLVSPTVANQFELHVVRRGIDRVMDRGHVILAAMAGPDATNVDDRVGAQDVPQRIDAGLARSSNKPVVFDKRTLAASGKVARIIRRGVKVSGTRITGNVGEGLSAERGQW